MKKILKNPWVLGIGTTVIGGVLLSFILDWIKGVNWLSTLKTVVKFIVNIVSTILNFELKLWWILLGIGIIIVALIVISKIYEAKQESGDPEFLSYKEDYFGSWRWSWDWRFNKYDMKWHIDDDSVVAHCPKCDTPMFHDYHDTAFECPRCQFKTDYRSKHKTRRDVKVLIIDNLNRKDQENSK